MKKSLFCLFLASAALHANPDSFRENFADPATRTAALAELIPGSRDAYFHIALDQQLRGAEAEFRQTLAAWKAASERKENPVSLAGYDVLENRWLLLEYQNDPVGSLAGLIRKFDLKFGATKPDAAAAAESLPTALDPALVSEAVYEKAAEEKSPVEPYTHYRAERLWRELGRVEKFGDGEVRWFLNHLDRADLPGVVPLVDRALALDRSLSFTGQRLLKRLAAGQLASLLELHPDLLAKESFDIAWLAKHRPGAESDLGRDLPALAAHLQFCRDFALQLPPALSSLKAHILFHHLRVQAGLGNYPKDDFLAFLALPRSSHPLLILPKPVDSTPIVLDSDFADATTCPPIGDDEPLIRDYLQHFLGATDDASEFAKFIPEKRLAKIHARARLLAGGNPARWGPMLDPAAYKSLLEETRIGFAPGAPVLLDADADVSLALDLKNTPDLLVRIYELDLPAQLARNGSEPDVSIDLDGLVPHAGRHLKFAQAPILEHRETIALPELAGPGAWLVDFVSGQVSARVLVRKGRLAPYLDRTAAGQTVRVFDEKGNPVAGAVAKLGRETISAGPDGVITIPDAPNDPRTRGIVQAGKLAAPLDLESRASELKMDVRFLLDREQLLADRAANLHLRVRLTDHGREIPLDRIGDPALVLKASLVGGVTTERVIADDLKLSPVMEIPFQVPADLLDLQLTLRGTLTPATGGDPVKLTGAATYKINADLKSARIATAFFSPTSAGVRLEVRGRNGEPLPSRAISLEIRRDGFADPVRLQLRTDAGGRIDLGNLAGISSIKASGADIGTASFAPRIRHVLPPQEIHAAANSEIRLPLAKPAAAPDRIGISLLEVIDDVPVRDHFGKVSIADGELIVAGLPAGDFRLVQHGAITRILVSGGTENDGLLVSATRILPVLRPVAPEIRAATADNGELKIQLRGAGAETRVTVIGSRFAFAKPQPFAGPFAPPVPATLTPAYKGCGYLTDRRLSDETRYILDRRAAAKFPGVMLPRPGLLLNRWTEEDLVQQKVTGADGFDTNVLPPLESQGRTNSPVLGRMDRFSGTDIPENCDFLQFPAVVKFDLAPAADGTLMLPLADFQGSQSLKIVAAAPFASDTMLLPLAPSDTPLRDRRLARPLEPQAHYLAARSAAVLQQGAEASIENLLDADWRAFTTLAEAQQFLYGATGDERLRDFAFLPDWPDFTEEKKLELLASHHCHEFHLFLARKDKAFFERHVKPMLARKLAPDFIDDLLLGRDLKPYLRPYAWQRLNAAEKALLAQALPAAKERISKELKLRWDLEAPDPETETRLFTQTLRGSDLATEDSLGLARKETAPVEEEMVGSPLGNDVSAGSSYVAEKLRRIVIPRIDLEDVTLVEAVDFLWARAVELDSELDPAKKGINIVIRRPSGGGANDPGKLRIRSLHLKDVPIEVALRYIADQTKMRVKTDDYAVTLVPQTETGEDLFTRTFRVPPDFAAALDAGAEETGAIDPFAEPGPGATSLRRRPAIAELLKQNGILMPQGSSATLSSSGVLLFTGPPAEMDKVEALLMTVDPENRTNQLDPRFAPDLATGASVAGIPADPFADTAVTNGLRSGDQAINRNNIDAILNNPNRTVPGRRAPSFPDRTKLWREANYYRSTAPTGENLIPLNGFWIDLAGWDGKGPFLSPHFNACKTNANEALMCLALLDLPFKAERPEVAADGGALRVKAREPMLLFYKDTRRTDKVAAESPLLVRQTFSPLAEPFRTVKGRKIENPVSGDFRPGAAYRASLVVTNPTGLGRRIDLLAQIPAGSIPLAANPATLSLTKEIQPYGVVMAELAFYFPAVGNFAIYPLHVSEDGEILAHTEPRTLRVSNDPAPVDKASWGVLASEGADDEVLARLRSENLWTVDFDAIRWRLEEPMFYLATAEILRERLFHSPVVASYGFRHNDPRAIGDFVENSDLASRLGDWLDSPLLEIRPRVHHDWETLEFDPLVNARAHDFAGEPRLTHAAALEHYRAFLDQLAWKPALDATDEMTLAAFLFLQDRVGEALARFDKIDPAKLPSRLNYDYLHAVALFYREKPEEAKTIAAAELPTVPPGLWHDRFQAVIDQADEIVALRTPAENAAPEQEKPAPQLELALAGDGKIAIRHRGLDKAELRLFSVDLEVLFSKNPFLQAGGADSADPAIRPNADFVVPLPAGEAETAIELPAEMRKGNVLVAAESGPTKLLKVLDSRAFEIVHTPETRTLQVLDAATRKPLAAAYVKVYAETNDGRTVFHKDGYADLRGKFDYLSSTATDPATVRRLAILVSDPEKGAKTVIYDR